MNPVLGEIEAMDFSHLKTFLEVSRNRSFSRAAEKLHITQPSISAQIRTLETEVGHRLFERGGGKVTLTAAGRLFEPFAEDCLLRLSHINLAIGDLERLPRGSLTVSANESTALYVLPSFFARFKKQYPRVSLNIIRAERARTIEAVLSREVDFGVVSTPIKDSRLDVQVIHEEELVLVSPPTHPLARGEAVSMHEVAQHNLLVAKQGRRREMLDLLFADRKLRPRIAMELDSNELLKKLILAGMGMGFLPQINVLSEVRAKQLAIIPIEDVRLPRNLALISHKDRQFTRAGNVFYQVVTSAPRPARAKAAKT
jgi:DNA-binding transcriptional LysR family regulator